MGGDDKPDFLREEEENDPARVQKEYMEFAKEILASMKKDKQDRKRELASETGLVGAYPADFERYRAPRPTLPITVQGIENGFLVHHGAAHNPDTEYARYPEEVVAIVSRVLGGFLQRILPGQPVGMGVPPCPTPGPEAGKGLPEGSSSGIPSVPWTPPKKAGEDPSSAGMTRVEGPPPVHEEPLGPLEP